MIKATVVILTKNPGTIIYQVLKSVLSQKVDFEYKVLVVDSGSKDGTVEGIKNLKSDLIELKEIDSSDFGHGRTRNFAVSLCESEYVLMLTHDACPVDSIWLQKMVDTADSDPQIAGVFGRHIAYKNSDPYTKNELVLHFSGFEGDPVVKMEDKDRYSVDIGYQQYLHFFSDNNSLLRKSVWERIPYPDVDFAEDQMWAKKTIESGYKKAYCKEGVVFHSHSYGLFERLQRSFDEAYAFRRFFGYRICPTLKSMARGYAGLLKRDMKLTLQKKLFVTHLGDCLMMPFHHFMRVVGQYLGTYGHMLPDFAAWILSRDRKVLAGKLSASKG